MQKTKISILGCGWLGFPLANALLEKDFLVNGSTTSEHKLALLESSAITPFLIVLNEDTTDGNVTKFLENSEILIINIPPRLRAATPENFTLKIQRLIPFIVKSSVQNVLFVSSTSVYSDSSEIITEQTLPKPTAESGRQLWAVEQMLTSNTNFKTTVVRFGGLIGGDRHPVYSLSGKQNLDNPEAPINLIHLNDCIGIILKLIERNVWNETMNAVTPFHPSREKYYVEKAEHLGLDLPTFNHNIPSAGKIIDSAKLIHLLDYKFVEPQL